MILHGCERPRTCGVAILRRRQTSLATAPLVAHLGLNCISQGSSPSEANRRRHLSPKSSEQTEMLIRESRLDIIRFNRKRILSWGDGLPSKTSETIKYSPSSLSRATVD